MCNRNASNWELKISIVLQPFRITCKRLTKFLSFQLVYGLDVLVHVQYMVPNLRLDSTLRLNYDDYTI